MARREFRWNDWNVNHIAKHCVWPEQAEHVVRFARRPYPRRAAKRKYLVIGRDAAGQMLRDIYLMDEQDMIYVIHAMPTR